jgi:DNA modification methylase
MLPNSSQIQNIPLTEIKNYKHKLRKYGKKQIEKAIHLIQETGFPPVVIVSKNKEVVTGQFLIEAAKIMGLKFVSVIQADNLDEKTIRLLRLGLDRLRDEEEWITDALSAEVQELKIDYPDLDLTLTGFEIAELDFYLDLNPQSADDQVPALNKDTMPITQRGDLWLLGDHRLYCGDALQKDSYVALMKKDTARIVLTYPPYNVPIDGHVCGKGKIKHREFENASGEMSQEEFIGFLAKTFQHLKTFSQDGSLQYIFMDWRHSLEVISAAQNVDFEHKNTCIWVKDNGGMGSLYRSRHEMVHIFKNGKKPHTNNIELGKYGRYRTNVWEYPGVNSFAGEQDDLLLHPTVKPVALLADAIKDVTAMGDIVLDPFGGSGSTLIAAEKTNRSARILEIDEHYCDVIIRRWQDSTGNQAIHTKTKKSFSEMEANSHG